MVGRIFRNANREDAVVGKAIAIPGPTHQNSCGCGDNRR